MADDGLTLRLIRSGTTRPRQRTPAATGCIALSVLALVTSMIFGQVNVIVLAAPFLIATIWTLIAYRPSEPEVLVRVQSARVLEGDSFDIRIEVGCDVDLPRVEVELGLSDKLTPLSPTRMIGSVSGNQVAAFVFTVEATQWGLADVSSVRVRTTDRFGMFVSRWDFRCPEPLQVVLPDHRLRRGLAPDRYRRIVGGHLSTDRGDGLELADIRPFQPGDPVKNINWRISNRRQEPWVTLRHPDQSATLVIVVDLDDDHDPDGSGTRRRSTAGALALARSHLALQDRVGLLIVGRTRRWIAPALGMGHLYRLGDALVSVGNTAGASMRSYQPAPAGGIPANAIVVAFSPLTDPLVVGLLARLGRQGNPVSVIQPLIDARPTTAPTRRRLWHRPDRVAESAKRLARLEMTTAAAQLRERSILITPWEEDVPVEAVIDTVRRAHSSVRRSTGGRAVSV